MFFQLMYYTHFVSLSEMSANSNKLCYIRVVLPPRDAYLDVLFFQRAAVFLRHSDIAERTNFKVSFFVTNIATLCVLFKDFCLVSFSRVVRILSQCL